MRINTYCCDPFGGLLSPLLERLEYPGSGVVLVSIPDLYPLSYFQLSSSRARRCVENAFGMLTIRGLNNIGRKCMQKRLNVLRFKTWIVLHECSCIFAFIK